MKNDNLVIPEKQLQMSFNRWRSFLITVMEAKLGPNSESFLFLRTKTLKALGDNGLYGELIGEKKNSDDIFNTRAKNREMMNLERSKEVYLAEIKSPDGNKF